jgi:hypothetical protein
VTRRDNGMLAAGTNNPGFTPRFEVTQRMGTAFTLQGFTGTGTNAASVGSHFDTNNKRDDSGPDLRSLDWNGDRQLHVGDVWARTLGCVRAAGGEVPVHSPTQQDLP